MRKTLLAAAAVAALFWASSAGALPFIAAGSNISFDGNDTFTPTSIDFLGLADNLSTRSGSFTALGTCLACVTANNFNSASVNFTPYTVTELGVTTSLLLTSANFAFVPGVPGLTLDTLTITGSGTAFLTGFAPTPGIFSFTTQGSGNGIGTFTWSSTTAATAVTEPGTLAILGGALLSMGLAIRRRFRG